MTDCCLFMLVMSLKEIFRRKLPTPDFEIVDSSATIFWVLARGFGRLGTTAPALRVKSDRKESLSEANFRRAFSKSASFSGPDPFTRMPLIVALLLLLSVPFLSEVLRIDCIESRLSSESRDIRL